MTGTASSATGGSITVTSKGGPKPMSEKARGKPPSGVGASAAGASMAPTCRAPATSCPRMVSCWPLGSVSSWSTSTFRGLRSRAAQAARTASSSPSVGGAKSAVTSTPWSASAASSVAGPAEAQPAKT